MLVRVADTMPVSVEAGMIQRVWGELYDKDDLEEDLETLAFFEGKFTMKTIVSNTSHLRYLTCIGEHDLLPELFEKVFIPKAVYQELTHKNCPIGLKFVR